jgi:hypothetical protein
MGRGLVTMGAVALLAALAAPAQALPDETWLVVVGNNRGDGDDGGLLYAERDARELADVFRTVGRVSSQRISLLLDESADTVRRAIVEINARLRGEIAAGRPPTALVVFYSGHADAMALHLGATRLPFDELRSLVESSSAAIRLLIVDACRSGSVTRVKGVVPAEEFQVGMTGQIATEGVAIVTSSAAGESSQESDRLRGSFFSHHLASALRGAADHNGDGRVTLAEAYEYTYAQTLRSSGRTLVLQHPTYSYEVKGRGELVLSAPGQGDGRSGRLRLGEAGVYLISERSDSGPVVAELAPARDGAWVALPADHYFVQHRGASEYREYEVALAAGGEADLSDAPFRAVRYDRLVRQRGGARPFTHGITALAGLRGEAIAGEGAMPQVVLGYGLDLPWATVGLRARLGAADSDGPEGRRHEELGLGLALQRFVDLAPVSVAFGLVLEGGLHRQTFHNLARQAPAREGASFGFAGLFSAERGLWRGMGVRVEGGPLALLFPRAVVADGTQVGREVASALTWWASAGLVWRL